MNGSGPLLGVTQNRFGAQMSCLSLQMIIFNFTYFLGTKFSKSLKSKFTYWKSRNGDFPGPVERQSRSARLLGALWNRSQLLFQPKSTILNFHIFKFIYFNIYFVVLIFKSTDFEIYAKSQNTSSTVVFYQYGGGVFKISARLEHVSHGTAHFTPNLTLQPAYGGSGVPKFSTDWNFESVILCWNRCRSGL